MQLGSGYRLITVLIAALLEESISTVLVDEPELGIGPEHRGVLSSFFVDDEKRRQYFPHIETLIVATHSHIFLDRKQIMRNFYVQMAGGEIHISSVSSFSDLAKLHFSLLGNRIEDLFLPSLIVFVEGKTDRDFINKILSMRFPDRNINVIAANADSRIKELVHTTSTIFGEFQKSPYRDRVIVLLDSIHKTGLKQELVAKGLNEQNIVILPKNGIEFYYPRSILDEIFGASGEIEIVDEIIAQNGIRHTKAELSNKVVNKIETSTAFDPEFERLFLEVVRKVIDG